MTLRDISFYHKLKRKKLFLICVTYLLTLLLDDPVQTELFHVRDLDIVQGFLTFFLSQFSLDI